MPTDKSSRYAVLAAVCAAFLIAAPSVRAEDSWPDLSKPAGAVGGGERDAAVIVGAENYAFVEHVPGAKQNANDWQEYLTETLKVPADRVALLLDNDATNDAIRSAAVEKASQVEEGGTLWFVFIGHGAPSKDGGDGLLVGVDAQQKASSVYSRSSSRNELLGLLAKGKQAKTVVLIDACFSGKSSSGRALVAGLQPLLTMRALPAGIDNRTVLMTAAKSDQFAGPLPGGSRPAFSYLALGALRGWAANAQGQVTASGLVDYIRRALSLSRDRTQTPELSTPETAAVVLGKGREAGPDLAKLQREAASSAGRGFQVTDLAAVPAAEAPKELNQAASGLDLGGADVDSLEKYDGAVKFEKGGAAPADKAAAWRQLAKDAPKFADLAGKRAQEWDRFEAQKNAADAAREKRVEARDEDWKKLGRLLNLQVVSEADKTGWSAQFLKAYSKSPGVEPGMAKVLAAHVPEGPVRAALKKLALKAQEEDTMSSAVLKHLQATQAYKDLKKIFEENKGKTGWLDGEAGRAAAAVRDSMLADAAAVTTPKDKTDKNYGLLVVQINGKTRGEDGVSLEDLFALNKKGEFKNPEYRDVIADAIAQDIVAGHSAQLARATSNQPGIHWVRIPGGSFMMGGDPWSDNTKPAHRVTVKSFELAMTVVTNKQYKACVEAGACTAAHVSDGTCAITTSITGGLIQLQGKLPDSFQGDDQPVVCVDWEQSKAYAAWAGGRLPSESEWEYAAVSAGKAQKYPWGDADATCERAVVYEYKAGAWPRETGCGKFSTWPVCSKTEGNTEQGLCDMAGNASEWVEDWKHDSYNGAPADSRAWESPTGSYRVIRGSSWSSQAGGYDHSDHRNWRTPDNRGDDLGFRVAR
jgi:formylglycine-generating enzyme required for sulfatase activity